MAAMRFAPKNTIRSRPRHLVDEQFKSAQPAASAHSITPVKVVKTVAGIGEAYYRRSEMSVQRSENAAEGGMGTGERLKDRRL
jgi:hypothetical protein